MKPFFVILILAGLGSSLRIPKLLSLFNIVRFQNEPCTTRESASLEGICYTLEQCLGRDGLNAGPCALGFGVCCLFRLGCGAATSENCTIFASSAAEVEATIGLDSFCTLRVCPESTQQISQIRLDFVDFSLAGPSSDTTATGLIANGQILDSGLGVPVTSASRCETDYFQATSDSRGRVLPPICGQNSGEHVYIDTGDDCINLSVFLSKTPPGSPQLPTPSMRQWSLKLSLFRSDFNNLAPQGCSQWFFGSTSGVVRSFNFDGGLHLASQTQNICVRRERGTCEICWSTIDGPQDFQVSGPGDMAITDYRLCCGYGNSGTDSRGFDCLVIPGALSVDGKALAAVEFCGASKGLASRGTMTADVTSVLTGGQFNKSICSKLVPFQIRFVSDEYEYVAEATNNPDGFELGYTLRNC